jgi:hypothetical protein
MFASKNIVRDYRRIRLLWIALDNVDQLLISSIVRKIITIHCLHSVGKGCVYVAGLKH